METKPIPGFPRHRATSDGRVQYVRSGWTVWRDVSVWIDHQGYAHLSMQYQFKRRTHYLHRFIAEVFIPNPDGLPCVRHLDGDNSNNAVSNLAWGTLTDNEHDKKAHGTWWNSRLRSAKLNEELVLKARELFASGVSQSEIGRQFGVDSSAICRIVNGKRWGHINAQ